LKYLKNQKGALLLVELVILALVLVVAGFAVNQYIKNAKTVSKATTPKPHVVAKASPSPSETPKPANKTTTASTSPAPPPSPKPKGSAGPCGPAVPRSGNGNVYCDLTITSSQLPVEVRMLGPIGNPGYAVTCSVSNSCWTYGATYTDQNFFTTNTFTDPFTFEVAQPVQITIAVPIIRSKQGSDNGQFGTYTYTSSYWVYGPDQSSRCCGTNPPLIYDLYNGYTQSFSPAN
jgi:hypothetical protein